MNTRALLAVSGLANLVMAAALVVREARSDIHAPKPSVSTPSLPSARTNALLGAFPARRVAADGATDKGSNFDWHAVESEDYRQYVANLRSIGCPEKTIRDIITADVNELFASKRREVLSGGKKYEYWKAGMNFGMAFDESRMQKAQELNREKRTLLKELLGMEPPAQLEDLMGAGVNPLETMLDFVASDKRTGILELEQRFGVEMAKILSGGTPDADDLAKLKKLTADKEAELAKLLTPEELEQYQLRMSQTSMVMRAQLQGFDPTEKEFKDLFALRKKFDDEFGGMFGIGTDAGSATRAEAERKLDQGIKELLGEDRYKEYQRGQDFSYQSMVRVAEKQGLDRDAANKAYEIKRAAEEQANVLRANSNITAERRQAALQAIYDETSQALTQTLGQKGFTSLESQPGGYWLKPLKGPALSTPSPVVDPVFPGTVPVAAPQAVEKAP